MRVLFHKNEKAILKSDQVYQIVEFNRYFAMKGNTTDGIKRVAE